jgi:hypothetical protein
MEEEMAKEITLSRMIEKWIRNTEFRSWFFDGLHNKRYYIAPPGKANSIHILVIHEDEVTCSYWGFLVKAADPNFFARLKDFMSFLRGHTKREHKSHQKFMDEEKSLLRKTLGRKYVK